MAREAIKPSSTLARLLRQSREASGYTLKTASSRTQEFGDAIPPSTLARIEQGKTDPGVLRLVQLIRVYGLAPEQVFELIEAANAAEQIRVPDGDPAALYEEGVRRIRSGELQAGMAYMLAVRNSTTDDGEWRRLRQKAALTVAICARNLGRIKLASKVIEELLIEDVAPDLRVSVLMFAGALWRARGAFEAALAFYARAELHLLPEEPAQRAMLLHETANTLHELGQNDEALRKLEEADPIYEHVGDHANRALGNVLRAHVLGSAGRLEEALACTREVQEVARRGNFERTRQVACIYEGEFLTKLGRPADAQPALEDVLAAAVKSGNTLVRYRAHFWLWKTLEALGHAARGAEHLDLAITYANWDELTEETKELREIRAERTAAGAKVARPKVPPRAPRPRRG